MLKHVIQLNVKRKVILSLACFTLLFSSVNFAESFENITEYHEIIRPSGSGAEITASVTAIPNIDGQVYLPTYKKGELASYEVLKGTLLEGPIQFSIHGREALLYRFKRDGSPVTVKQSFEVQKVYREKKAKLKYSHPGGVTRVSYTFVNTSPSTIETFSTQFSMPKDAELYGVVTPKWSKKKKTFSIGEHEGWKEVTVSRSSLVAGDEVKLKVRLYRPSPMIKWVLWSIVILLSCALLWKRRDVLSENPGNHEPQSSLPEGQK
ncbi:hypothetical protein CS022_14125 [Veronia nyctiphanis]|uniref:Uncharacterized protein n=1 Tax=Veronia nyctiphanis TaxID=1278244 RepID=A0A4Q0YQC6_9GAMM|nr:hypothetical protein [Veronia nyctiphanis]RXJ72765.1 hypothetical protein CS022_14125 [Veronia nyctiphanis]